MNATLATSMPSVLEAAADAASRPVGQAVFDIYLGSTCAEIPLPAADVDFDAPLNEHWKAILHQESMRRTATSSAKFGAAGIPETVGHCEVGTCSYR